MLSSQLREHLPGWRDNRIEDLLLAILGIEVADDLEHCPNVRSRDEFANPAFEGTQAVNNSFNVVIDGKPGLVTAELPGVGDRNRRIDSLAAPHKDRIWIDAEHVRDRICRHHLAEQTEVDILTDAHKQSMAGT